MSKNVHSAFAVATGSAPVQELNAAQISQPTDRFVRRPEVCHLTSVPSSSLTDLINRGDFPSPFKLSARMAAWKLSEVTAWMDSREKSA